MSGRPFQSRASARGVTVVFLLACSSAAWAAGCDPARSQVEAAEDGAQSVPEPARPPRPPAPEPKQVPAPAEDKVPKTPATFEAAVEAARAIGADHRRTFYCGCIYTVEDKVARGTCGYETRAEEALARRIVWERVVPLRAFGSHRRCWTNTSCTNAEGATLTGVPCCMEQDPQFRAMATDLFNIAPIIGEIAQDRSSYDFAEIDGEQRLYGACDFEVDRHRALAEPAEAVRGDIARIYLYMHEVYGDGLPLSPLELQQFRTWHEADPPDDWERRRSERIAAEQGLPNPFVSSTTASAD